MAPHPRPTITTRQEGSAARVETGRLDFLFPESEAHDIEAAYGRLILMADSHFAPRWTAHPGANIDPDAFYEIIQEVTLHWMYLCAVNHLALQIADDDWDHPQTRRIIQSGVKRSLPPGSGAGSLLCANLLGLSEAEYVNWSEADDAFLGIM